MRILPGESRKLANSPAQRPIRHGGFNFESGLAENSEWAQNEEMVDFFAIQFPKLMEAFKNADAI
nr:MAG TPA: hypothetical protein [Caudoviricetes sp.]